ncbi:MAG: IS5/IS1182 family transposase, partial [Beijerinckiaceae bacterium]
RVEHVFGDRTMSMGAKIVRAIGMARATMKIGTRNLACNMRRLDTLERMAAAA